MLCLLEELLYPIIDEIRHCVRHSGCCRSRQRIEATKHGGKVEEAVADKKVAEVGSSFCS